MTDANGESRSVDRDALRAVRFLAIKAAVFILVPLAAALLAVYFTLS